MLFFNRLSSLIYGLKLPFAAFKLITQKKSLLLWSVLPVVITFVLYWYGISALQDTIKSWLFDFLSQRGMAVDGWWKWLVEFFVNIVLIIAGAMTFAFTSTMLASPFNDLLAEKTEHFVQPALPPPAKNGGIKHQIRLVGIDLMKSIAATAAGLTALIMSWIPVVNLFSFMLAFLLICFQYTSYPQTRRGVKLKDGLRFLWDHLFACAGFGATVTFLFALPFVSIFALPAAVVGGTLLVARAKGDSQLKPLK